MTNRPLAVMIRAPMLPLLAALLLLAAATAWGETRALEPNALFEPGWRAHIGANAGAYAIRRAPAPDRRPAIRFELRFGDCMANRIRDCDTGRERAELRSVDEAPPGSERWYRYGLFVPFGHPEPGVAEIMANSTTAKRPCSPAAMRAAKCASSSRPGAAQGSLKHARTFPRASG
jgi:hypothetical protein